MPRKDATSRRYEHALLALVAISVLTLLGNAWWDARRDREARLVEATLIGDTLTAAVAGRFESVFRDAMNAAVSAAILVESRGGLDAMGGEAALKQELKRELWNETSTARLVAVAPDGRVVASSTGRGSEIRLATPGAGWALAVAGRSPMTLGPPERSPFDGEWVLPLWATLEGRKKETLGWIRAEVRSSYMERFIERLSGINVGTLSILASDGTTLIRVPHDDNVIGSRRPGVTDFLAQAQGDHGATEFAPQFDNRPRLYSWKRPEAFPVVIAVGFDKELVLARWRTRTTHRVIVSLIFSLAIAGLTLGLVVYVRRLDSAREESEELQHRYWEGMRASSNGIAIADMQGKWLQVNPALTGMLGHPANELLSGPGSVFSCPETRGALDALATRAAAGGGGDHFLDDHCLLHRDGTKVWVDVQATLLRDRDGRPRELVFHFQDVTTRKLAEDALRCINDELERRIAERTADLNLVNEDLEAFTYSVAHDLRGPISRLAAFVDVLGRELEAPSDRVERRLVALRRQAREMNALVDDLLDFARAGKKEMSAEWVDMDQLVAGVRQELEPETAGRVIEWHVQPLPQVSADRSLMREVWRNLIGNAVKYSKGRSPAQISIGSFQPSDTERGFFIQDNGAGFDEAYAEQLFTPFRRLHSTSEFEGTGVGLAIVHRILSRHGGRIWGNGATGQGASFFFALPAQRHPERSPSVA